MDNTQPAINPPARDEVTTSVSWEASEYVQHDKDWTWSAILILVALSLAALAYFVLDDLFTVAVIVLLALAVGVYGHRPPRTLTYKVGESGLSVGDRLHNYDKFRSFSIIDEGTFKSIMLEPTKRVMPPVSVYFQPEDEDRIVEVLSGYLPYKQRELDFADRLFRKLRF